MFFFHVAAVKAHAAFSMNRGVCLYIGYQAYIVDNHFIACGWNCIRHTDETNIVLNLVVQLEENSRALLLKCHSFGDM